MSDKKTLVPVHHIPGSKPLKIGKHERYARYRAQALPRIEAFRKLGNYAANDKIAHNNASRLEKRRGVRDRINYLIKRAEEHIAEKRARLEQRLWSVHEADLADYFETYNAIERDHTGQPKHDENGALSTQVCERPKLLEDLPPEAAKLIADITIDSKGRAIPKLYSKLAASKELRAMLNLSSKTDAADVMKLSDQELLLTLAQQARELNIEIDLSYYTFAQQPKEPDK